MTVSIIIPCYNGARFIRSTIESALAQTEPPLEAIVIDDGSKDDSASIAEGFGPPVRVMRQANQGESVARNRGIAEARGTHALFLDADDLLAPDALRHLTSAVHDRPEAVAVMASAWFTDDPQNPIGFKAAPVVQDSFFPGIIENNLAPVHSWLAPIDLLRRAGGFHEPLCWFEDWDLWWRVGLLSPKLVSIDYVGALYRQHAASQLSTTKIADRTRGHARLMDRMAAAFLDDPPLIDRYGDQLFWSCWTALSRAHEHGVPWHELESLAQRTRDVLKHRPPGLDGSRIARTVSLVGPRATLLVGALLGRSKRQQATVGAA
jgi:glycosyltransferase involved in cell wall biosynthesis